MSEDRFVFEPLGQQPNRTAFSCGQDDLDRYFRERAGQDRRRDVTACFVLVDREQQAVVGYYTLSAGAVVPRDLPEDVVKRLPRYPSLPAVVMGRFAVDTRYQGRGFAKKLLMNALIRAWEATKQVAAIAVIVDAKDETAAAFYQRFGFIRFPDSPLRLFLPMATIRTVATKA